MIVGFGAASTTGAECPATGDWDSYCDCMWPAGIDPSTNSKCKSWRPGAPWTAVGAMLRGIPQEAGGINAGGLINSILTVVSGGGPSVQQGPVAAKSSKGIFGIPETIAIVGGGVLAIGTAAYFISRRKVRRR